MEMIIFVGIQCSGKTTFFKQRFSNTHGIISLDVLRNRHDEEELLRYMIGAQRPIVIDNTNPSREARARYIAEGKRAGYRIVGYLFKTPIALALARNKARNADHDDRGIPTLPDVAIFATAKKLNTPVYCEGFDAIHLVRSDRPNYFLTTLLAQ